jgi:hypothetical protein
VRAEALAPDPVPGSVDPLVGVGAPLAVAAGFVGWPAAGGEIDDATTVLGGEPVAVVASLAGTRGATLGELGMVVVAGAGSVVSGAVCGGLGGSVVATGVLATVVVTVGGTVATGAGVVGGGGDAEVTDAVTCGGGSIAAGADGAAGADAARGGCAGGAETTWGTRPDCGAWRPGLGGATCVVVGPVPGSAIDGVIPPVIADNEIAVPEASTTTRPRQLRTRNAAPIAR